MKEGSSQLSHIAATVRIKWGNVFKSVWGTAGCTVTFSQSMRAFLRLFSGKRAKQSHCSLCQVSSEQTYWWPNLRHYRKWHHPGLNDWLVDQLPCPCGMCIHMRLTMNHDQSSVVSYHERLQLKENCPATNTRAIQALEVASPFTVTQLTHRKSSPTLLYSLSSRTAGCSPPISKSTIPWHWPRTQGQHVATTLWRG